jgi:hypothetical protein
MTDSGTTPVPDGWEREEMVAGMGTVTSLWDGPQIGGGLKCDRCDHFIPIDELAEPVCPMCDSRGLIGTIIQGRQEVTMLFPSGLYRNEEDE